MNDVSTTSLFTRKHNIYKAAYHVSTSVLTKKTRGANTNQSLPSSWCDIRRCRCCPGGDPDYDSAATPETVFAQSQRRLYWTTPDTLFQCNPIRWGSSATPTAMHQQAQPDAQKNIIFNRYIKTKPMTIHDTTTKFISSYTGIKSSSTPPTGIKSISDTHTKFKSIYMLTL